MKIQRLKVDAKPYTVIPSYVKYNDEDGNLVYYDDHVKAVEALQQDIKELEVKTRTVEFCVIEWGSVHDPNDTVSYTHCIGSCPLGVFLITWKGWKDSPSYDIEDSPISGDTDCTFQCWTDYGHGDLDEAKEAAQRKLNEVITSCISGVDKS